MKTPLIPSLRLVHSVSELERIWLRLKKATESELNRCRTQLEILSYQVNVEEINHGQVSSELRLLIMRVMENAGKEAKNERRNRRRSPRPSAIG